MLPQSYFYAAEPEFKDVSKEEFEKFLKEYPRKLERGVHGIISPPGISYNDFELSNRYPYSSVATTLMYDDDPQSPCWEPEERRVYKIMENYEEVFASKTGNVARSSE